MQAERLLKQEEKTKRSHNKSINRTPKSGAGYFWHSPLAPLGENAAVEQRTPEPPLRSAAGRTRSSRQIAPPGHCSTAAFSL